MRRLEGLAKLTGAERFIDDEPFEGLWGMTVRSPFPRGRVRELRFSDSIDWSEFTVVTHEDIPGANAVYLMELDQPVLAGEYVRHVHEAVALVAHPSRAMAREAIAGIEIIVDPDEPVYDYRVTPDQSQVQYGEDNILKRLLIDKGDVEAALAQADHIVEGVYETGAQEHVYLENQGMIARVEDGVVVVRGSMQCPYYVVNALKHALGRAEHEVRVIQAPTGGGFGGKEDYPSIIALHTALLTLKAGGAPVKMIYDRSEDMAATTKRHPSRVRHRTGLDAEGRLVAQHIEVVMDGGAYVTLSPVVLSRGIIHAAGPYACDNVRIEGRAVLTNAVPFGAFRGFGAPQTHFANERHMDVVAKQIGMDPVELRRVNLIREGQTTATGQVITGGADRVGLMDRALELAQFNEKRREHDSFNVANQYLRRGVGLATFHHGAGFTGSGEVYLASRLLVEGLEDGRVEVLTASTEMGQGMLTIFTDIASQALGLEPGDIVLRDPDTSRAPNSGPTVASRTAMVVGRLVEKACEAMRARLGVDKHTRGEELKRAIVEWRRQHPDERLVGESQYEQPPNVNWDDETYQGDAYATFSWGAYVAEVEVDLRTFNTRVLDFVAVQEVGRVLNETLARGQVQGGVVQGIGWALLEEMRTRDGAMINNQLTNYIIPTSDDVPSIRVEFQEEPYEFGGGGAKGLGELPMDGPAPAIANAVAAALNVDPKVIPLTSERLMELMETVATS